jgi:hypothetical protein
MSRRVGTDITLDNGLQVYEPARGVAKKKIKPSPLAQSLLRHGHMKIVINAQYGGFGLSKAAVKRYRQYSAASEPAGERTVPKLLPCLTNVERSDPNLVRVVEELGCEANGDFSMLKVVEVPDGVEWNVQDSDGDEWVAEVHRTWR